jgi:hypothetical protein
LQQLINVLTKSWIGQHAFELVFGGRLKNQGFCVLSQSAGSSCRHTSSVEWFHDQCKSKASSASESKPSTPPCGEL